MGLKVKTVNTAFERACKNCGVDTRVHYRVEMIGEELPGCKHCIGKVIVGETNECFTRRSISSNHVDVKGKGVEQWHDEIEPLDKDQLVRLFDDEFINDASAVRSDASVLQRPKNIPEDEKQYQYYDDMLDELCEEELIRETTVGVDDGLAYEPSFDRQAEYIIQLALEEKWVQEYNISENRIETVLEKVSNNTQYEVSELRVRER